MNQEALEARLQENEGLIFGLIQVVSLLVGHAKLDAAFRHSAARCLIDMEVVNINSTLSDHALDQARAFLQSLLKPDA